MKLFGFHFLSSTVAGAFVLGGCTMTPPQDCSQYGASGYDDCTYLATKILEPRASAAPFTAAGFTMEADRTIAAFQAASNTPVTLPESFNAEFTGRTLIVNETSDPDAFRASTGSAWLHLSQNFFATQEPGDVHLSGGTYFIHSSATVLVGESDYQKLMSGDFADLEALFSTDDVQGVVGIGHEGLIDTFRIKFDASNPRFFVVPVTGEFGNPDLGSFKLDGTVPGELLSAYGPIRLEGGVTVRDPDDVAHDGMFWLYTFSGNDGYFD